ncbi:MAG: cytochrome c maturation protein CcmE [Acidobacteria bacterium]|nr:cytochrome c maturation protein CcmE [Acidobacteriota bacterium]
MNQSTRPEHQRQNRRFAVIALVVASAAFAVLTLGGIGDNLVYYWDPAQMQEAGDKAYGATIRLGGLVVPGSVQWDGQSSELRFEVTDRENRAIAKVHSTGLPPQMFREGVGVVVEGTLDRSGWFESDRLLVSHDNEYRAPEPGTETDTRELIESTKGLGPES